MQGTNLQASANESRLALQDSKTFLRAPNEARCSYFLLEIAVFEVMEANILLSFFSKDELLDTPPATPSAQHKIPKLEKRLSLGAFAAPKNVDRTHVSLPVSVTGPCGLYYFVRSLVRLKTSALFRWSKYISLNLVYDSGDKKRLKESGYNLDLTCAPSFPFSPANTPKAC